MRLHPAPPSRSSPHLPLLEPPFPVPFAVPAAPHVKRFGSGIALRHTRRSIPHAGLPDRLSILKPGDPARSAWTPILRFPPPLYDITDILSLVFQRHQDAPHRLSSRRNRCGWRTTGHRGRRQGQPAGEPGRRRLLLSTPSNPPPRLLGCPVPSAGWQPVLLVYTPSAVRSSVRIPPVAAAAPRSAASHPSIRHIRIYVHTYMSPYTFLHTPRSGLRRAAECTQRCRRCFPAIYLFIPDAVLSGSQENRNPSKIQQFT